MPASGREPERTCVGCRRSGPKGMLLRVVRTPEGSVRLDPMGRGPGRGAYLHRSQECIRAGIRGGSLARSLRARLEPAEAATLMEQALRTVGENA